MTWPTMEATRDLGEYLRKGVPLSLMLCFEWWAFEVIILMSGWLGVAVQAAQTVFLQTIIILYCAIAGQQTAIACKVGNEIGRQDIQKAKSYYAVGKIIATV